MNFDSVDDLIRRMDQDCSQARHLLARAPDAFPVLGVPG
jgi:riboflavin kinase/FMN adenylyltransferase